MSNDLSYVVNSFILFMFIFPFFKKKTNKTHEQKNQNKTKNKVTKYRFPNLKIKTAMCFQI